MIYLLLLISFAASVFSDISSSDSVAPSLTEGMANHPSSVVNGVNVVTGQPSAYSEDMVIQGAEPIRIFRSLISENEWLVSPTQATLEQTEKSYRIQIWDKNGFYLIYKSSGEMKIGKEKYERFGPSEINSTVTNAYQGKISSRSNLKNNYILLDKEKKKHLTIHCCDGSIQTYKKINKDDSHYLPVSERLPNGNWLLYNFEEVVRKKEDRNLYRLSSIRSTNPSQTKEFARATFVYQDRKWKDKGFSIHGSDGQILEYTFHKDPQTGRLSGHLAKVLSPDSPPIHFGYESFKIKMEMQASTIEEEHERLTSIILSSHQRTKIDFYKRKKENIAGQELEIKDAVYFVTLPGGQDQEVRRDQDFRKNRVKTLSAPIGLNPNPQITHSFIYHCRKEEKCGIVYPTGKVSVYDILGDYNIYEKTGHYTKEKRDSSVLSGIYRYGKEKNLFNAEKFQWDLSSAFAQLTYKSFLDENQTPLSCNYYFYDSRGNVMMEKSLGNLSGKGAVVCDKKGAPITDGVEAFCKQYRYSSDEPNLLIEEKEDLGLRTIYEYLPGTDLPTSILTYDGDQLRITKTYQYNEDHILVRETVDDQATCRILEIEPTAEGPYIGMPRIIREKYADRTGEYLLKTTVNHYGRAGRIEQKDIYDAESKLCYSLKMDYDAKGRCIRETNALGQEALFRYDDFGNLIYKRDFSGRMETVYKYDHSNRLYEKQEIGFDKQQWITQYAYNAKHQLVGETDPRGHQTSYVRDALGRKLEVCLPTQSTLKMSYDAAGNVIRKVDAEGHVTQTRYNVYGKPTVITHPDGAKEEFEYFLDGKLKTQIDSEGIATSYEYDPFGKILRKTVSSREKILAEDSFEYNGPLLICKTDAENNKTHYAYDGAGRKISEECNRETTTYTYDALGRISTIQTGDLVTIQLYDLLGRLKEERKESISGTLHRKMNYEYDSAGNQTARITESAREEFLYDSANRLIEKKDPLGHVERFLYEDHFVNAKGERVLQKTRTDPMGLETVETYDILNQLIRVEIRKEKTLSIEENTYDANGRRIIQVNTIYSPDGSSRQTTTRWCYDSRGKVIQLTEADGTVDAKTTRYSYRPRGELDRTIKPDGTELLHKYNDLGHLILLTSSDRSVHHEMHYDRLGRLIQTGEFLRTLDAKGRILTESFTPGWNLENSYDTQGRKISCKIPAANCWIEMGYDAIDMYSVRRKTLDGSEIYSHNYTSRDLSGRVLEEKLISSLGAIQRQKDLLGRTIQMTAPHFSETVHEFDPAGNIRSLTIQGDRLSFKYDEMYQLTSESGSPFDHGYLYDSLYNRLQKDEESYDINALNQVVSHFLYDKNGNPTQCGDVFYQYDALDRLIRLSKPGLIQTFTYDALHRCLTKTTLQDGVGKTLTFLYDGQKEIGALDERQRLVELRILGEAPHAEIGAAIAIELNRKVYAPIHDLHGNVALLIPTTGEEPTSHRYSSFGEEKTTGHAPNPWRFSSKRSDAETGLVYYGRRFYSPEFGRWMNPDPGGFEDGMNLYVFVHNDPLTHFDEYGLLDYGQWNWNKERERPTPLNSALGGIRDGLISGFVHPLDTAWNLSGDLARFGSSAMKGDFSNYRQSWQSMDWQERVYQGTYRTAQLGGAVLSAIPVAKGMQSLAVGGYNIGRILWQSTGRKLGFSKALLPVKGVSPISQALQEAEILTSRMVPQSQQINTTTRVVEVEKMINSYLGDGTKLIKNEAGDLIFISQDRLRKIRFDFISPKPHNNPHMHVQELVKPKQWHDFRIYPIDVPHN